MSIIPGTKSMPDTLEGWTTLYRGISSMSAESCEQILDANDMRLGALTTLEFRGELRDLCIRKGVNRHTG